MPPHFHDLTSEEHLQSNMAGYSSAVTVSAVLCSGSVSRRSAVPGYSLRFIALHEHVVPSAQRRTYSVGWTCFDTCLLSGCATWSAKRVGKN